MLGIKSKVTVAALSVAVISSLTLWGHWERSGRKAVQEQYRATSELLRKSEKARKAEAESAARVQALAKTTQEKLNDAQTRYDRAIADAIAGSAGLLINADCPAGVPEASEATGDADAGKARISRATELDIHRLRRDARVAETMIEGLQEYILSECQ